jgi:hypothetical protein
MVFPGMRALRALPITLALVTVGCSVRTAVTASRNASHHCAIPHGWRVVARDRQAIVIAQRRHIEPLYDYCNRRVGRFRQLTRFGPLQVTNAGPVIQTQLAGPYVASVSMLPPPGPVTISLSDTSTGQQNEMSLLGISSLSPVPTFLLSPNGVAAAIVLRQPAGVGASPGAGIQILTLNSHIENLDGASPPSEIANLQLQNCTAADCAPNAVTVAWTNQGAQHSTRITPS